MHNTRKKDFFMEYRLWVLLVIVCALAAWIFGHGQNEAVPSSKIDPFSGPLVIDAPGCEIRGPDGGAIKDSLRASGQVMIPKGTSFNEDCFPDAKAAREADSKSVRA